MVTALYEDHEINFEAEGLSKQILLQKGDYENPEYWEYSWVETPQITEAWNEDGSIDLNTIDSQILKDALEYFCSRPELFEK
jgi:hypothetical protein